MTKKKRTAYIAQVLNDLFKEEKEQLLNAPKQVAILDTKTMERILAPTHLL